MSIMGEGQISLKRGLVCREELGICAMMRHGFVRDGGHMKGFAHV
jgi:hypothetical protein